ncbi:MAG: signal recognition particle-docking protein FtsY [Alphaproteobacteria bacterium]|nr:signal recognition particle-docking protein FtsY [Alphaproteobacteria bacterium]
MFGFFKKKETDKPEAPSSEKTEHDEVKRSLWEKLKSGLSKSTTQLSDGITGIFTKKKLDDETLDALEELLIKADIGVATAQKLTAQLRKTRFGKDISDREIREALADEITAVLNPVAATLDFSTHKPFVLVMVGVNGVGKTTTMGKLAKQLTQNGKKVLMVAGDTFRAAAVSQLEVWAQRANCELLTGSENADPASLAYKALEQAKVNGTDVVMIDTAGRLQNKAGLMAELQKIIRVIQKMDESAPHATLLVLDATTGQNAHTQVDVFKSLTAVSGLVLTKLDGSARGGVLVALADVFKLPVYAIGVGEGIDDLRPFAADAFAKALCGVE